MEARPLYVVEQRTNEPPESVVLRLDSTKSYVELGWKPLLSIGEAVSMTVEWHLRYQRDPACNTTIFAAADCRICRCLDREQREGVYGRTRDKDRSMRVNYGQSVYGEEEIAAELLDLPEGSEVITPVLAFATTVAH